MNKRSQIIYKEGKGPSITILIPMLGNGNIHRTIESVIAQNYYPVCEIFILHNGIQELPDGREIAEKDEYNNDTEPAAVCYTTVPHCLRRLMRQRDRWQRGLMDCLIKHHHMILNPHYGLIGVVTLFNQMLIELLGPVFWILYIVIAVSVNFDPVFYFISVGYVLIQIGMTIFAVSLDYRHESIEFLKLILKLALISIAGIILHIVIMGARIYGIITFHLEENGLVSEVCSSAVVQ